MNIKYAIPTKEAAIWCYFTLDSFISSSLCERMVYIADGRQLSTGMYYRPLECGDILHKGLVVLHMRVVDGIHFRSMHCVNCEIALC